MPAATAHKATPPSTSIDPRAISTSGLAAFAPAALGAVGGAVHGAVVRTILESKPHPEMGYRSCLGILRLAKRYSHERVEAAAARRAPAACSYQSVKSMLERGLDRQPLETSGSPDAARSMTTCGARLISIPHRRGCNSHLSQERRNPC